MQNLKKRISTLENIRNKSTAKWLESLSDEQLKQLADKCQPRLKRKIESLSDEDLQLVVDGKLKI